MGGEKSFNDGEPSICSESETSASSTSPDANAGSGVNDGTPKMAGMSEADGQNPPQPSSEFNDRPL